MTRTALIVTTAFLLGALTTAGVSATLLGNTAEAAGTRVVCSQMPQKPGQIDEVFVANFMSDQLAAGRTNFTTVAGVSTVMCAW